MASFRLCIVCNRNCERRGVSRCDAHGGKRQPFAGSKEAYQRFPEKVRQAVFARDGRRCQRCGSTTKLEIGHIIPSAAGGQPIASNGRVLCRRCNLKEIGDQLRGRKRGGQVW